MNTQPPTNAPAWNALAALAESWRDDALKRALATDATRAERLAAVAPGLHYTFARQRLDGAVRDQRNNFV